MEQEQDLYAWAPVILVPVSVTAATRIALWGLFCHSPGGYRLPLLRRVPAWDPSGMTAPRARPLGRPVVHRTRSADTCRPLGGKGGEGSMEPRIDETQFGSVTIDGKLFEHDVLIRLGGKVEKRNHR